MQSRIARNPGYSLRAFARDIGLAAPKLSQILKGSCGLSKKSALQVAKRLHLNDSEAEYFVTLVESEHCRSKSGKRQAKARIEELEAAKMDELDLERFRIISDWYHFSILELTEVQGFSSDLAWISRRLGISKQETSEAIERLLDHGLLARDEGGNLRQTEAHLATPSGIPSRELRNHHSQIFRKADRALDCVPIQERDFSANTFAVDSSQIDEARKALQEFRRKFCKDLQRKNPKDRIYCLAIQLFPLDRTETD